MNLGIIDDNKCRCDDSSIWPSTPMLFGDEFPI